MESRRDADIARATLMIQSRPRAGLQNAHALASSAAVERAITPRTLDYCWLFCGIGTLPVGPIAVTCRTTSPSFAQAKCGDLAGSEYNVPAGEALSLLSSHCSPTAK